MGKAEGVLDSISFLPLPCQEGRVMIMLGMVVEGGGKGKGSGKAIWFWFRLG